MKFLKITLRKNGTKLIYPTRYQLEIGDFAIDHLYYNDGSTPMLLLVIPNDDYKPSMIRDRVEEITEEEAKSISEDKEIRTEKVKDETKLRRLEIKSRYEKLTAEEADSIDPSKPGSIIGKNKILSDRINDLKLTEK